MRRLNRLRKDKRRYPRRACFVYVDYAVGGRWYHDAVSNVSPGGACIRTKRKFQPGDEISLGFSLLGLRAHIQGRIAWTDPRSIGLEFISISADEKRIRDVFDFRGKDVISTEKEIVEMGKISKRTIRWEPSTDAAKYRLYWSTEGPVGYESDFVELENKTQVILPDEVPVFPKIAGNVDLGITAVSAAGNESDITIARVNLDFTIPEAPKDLRVED
jgi:hypothetical protein